jgi:hypothetical protein
LENAENGEQEQEEKHEKLKLPFMLAIPFLIRHSVWNRVPLALSFTVNKKRLYILHKSRKLN